MPSNKLVLFAICIICIFAISTSGCIGESKGNETYESKYISFEYPGNWTIVESKDYGDGEYVALEDEYGNVIDMHVFTNKTLQDILSGITVPLKKETINGVECYINEDIYTGFCYFQKDGVVFDLRYDTAVKDVAKDIIASLKVKK